MAATVLHPAVLALTLVAGILMCIWPRKKALAAFLTAAILIPMDQVLLIGPAHFPMLRLLVLFAIVRMVRGKAGSKTRIFSGGLNKIDVFTILLTIFIAVNGILLFQASGEVINQLGNVLTVFGAYFLLRFLIRDEEDVLHAMQTLAWLAAFVAAVMTYEVMTGHNPYAMLGGARAFVYSSLAARDDRFRAQGPFGHSILAGTFGAIVMPLFVALWWKGRKYRKLAVVGVVSSTVIVLTSNSSTPVLGYAAGAVALGMWPVRQRMQLVRWGIVLILVSLHMVMKAPVWNLIARIDITGGSSGWHRYMLIDQCIHHFGDWWLIGVKDTSAWGWDMWDTANEYVATCDNSGLLPFIFFVAVLVYGFKYLGRARRAASKEKKRALFIWAMGAALFANVVSFIGISYFDQTQVVWYCFLAMIPVVALAQRKKELKPVEPEVLPAATTLVEAGTEMTWPLAEESVRTNSL